MGTATSATQSVYPFHPLADPRWAEFLERHPRASVFHTAAWLDALHRTYGYLPVAFTTAPPGTPLGNAIVACLIDSWVTGRRLVSLPFADHCEPLLEEPADWSPFAVFLEQKLQEEKWR